MDADRHTEIRLAELLGAFCHALDLTEGQPQGHCIRVCWIGMRVGRELGLRGHEIWELYYTLLLKDLGCTSNAARICELYLTDDLSFKQAFKQIDGSLPQALRFVLSHTGMKVSMAERFRAIIKIFQNGGEIARELIETRCFRGADIARRMRFPEPVAQGILHLDEHWDGKGKPKGVAGKDIPLYAQVALLAQVVDVFHSSGGMEAACTEIRQRTGTWFDPELAATFERVAAQPDFWEMLAYEFLDEIILGLEPAQQASLVDEDYLDDIAAAFAQVIDSKSPFTHGHSERVTLFADMVAEEMGFPAEKRRWLKRAALLHDIGKLGVSNTILDKPAKLNEDEFGQMKMHAVHSETILSRIRAFEDLAPIAAAHHERLDGRGYPKGLAGDEIATETRILTVADIFDALTADRPYRKAMPISQALGIMADDVGTAIDPVCFAALRRAVTRLDPGLRSELAA
jgi:putative nucleotidyltransferase with HDIG domain